MTSSNPITQSIERAIEKFRTSHSYATEVAASQAIRKAARDILKAVVEGVPEGENILSPHSIGLIPGWETGAMVGWNKCRSAILRPLEAALSDLEKRL